MIAEELVILDPDAALWQAVRPLLTIALNIEQREEYVWHGWSKSQITNFLAHLPQHVALVVGVWSTHPDEQDREQLQAGFVCEVHDGQVHTIRTFEALQGDDVPPISELEPGADHALAIMRSVRTQVAPVAWALFTDKATWDEWLTLDEHGRDAGQEPVDKGALLMTFARQGRCVLMGSQVRQYER
ncbi:MAG TPA: hypothetical protein DHW02_10910 [Ktedonobacter sp.]|nr:hypothetical protein [Ktedonobacter sp.]